MENQRNPGEKNLFERDTRNDFSSGPLMPAERDDASNDQDDDDDDTRWDDESSMREDLDEE